LFATVVDRKYKLLAHMARDKNVRVEPENLLEHAL
jgi:hypothetical protein